MKKLTDEAMADIAEFVRVFVYCRRNTIYWENIIKPILGWDVWSWLSTLSIYQYGWKDGNEGVLPVWYTCPPPGNQKRKKLMDVGDPVNPRESKRMGMDSQRNDDVDNNLEHFLDDQSQSLLSLEQLLDVD